MRYLKFLKFFKIRYIILPILVALGLYLRLDDFYLQLFVLRGIFALLIVYYIIYKIEMNNKSK